MHCYICDDIIPNDKVRVHPITKKVEPCPKCLEEIAAVVEEDNLRDPDYEFGH